MEGVAVLEEAALPALAAPSLLSLALDVGAAALLACVRDGSLSTAGEAGDRELDDVDEVAARFLGLLSFCKPVFAAVLLTPGLSTTPFLCFCSLAAADAAPCRGLTCSLPAATLLLSPSCVPPLCSDCATTALE